MGRGRVKAVPGEGGSVARTSRWSLAAVATVFAAGGCSESIQENPASAGGRVTFQGQPLIGGVIVFAPDSERGTPGHTLIATLDEQGEYRLLNDGSPQILPGWYKVAIADPPSPGRTSSEYAQFPASLRRPDQSGLQREIRPGQENWLEFHIEVSE